MLSTCDHYNTQIIKFSLHRLAIHYDHVCNVLNEILQTNYSFTVRCPYKFILPTFATKMAIYTTYNFNYYK